MTSTALATHRLGRPAPRHIAAPRPMRLTARGHALVEAARMAGEALALALVVAAAIAVPILLATIFDTVGIGS